MMATRKPACTQVRLFRHVGGPRNVITSTMLLTFDGVVPQTSLECVLDHEDFTGWHYVARSYRLIAKEEVKDG